MSIILTFDWILLGSIQWQILKSYIPNAYIWSLITTFSGIVISYIWTTVVFYGWLVIKVIKAMGVEALAEAVDNPIFNIAKAGIEAALE